MELSSGKLARFADGAAVVQVKTAPGKLHILVGHRGVQRSKRPEGAIYALWGGWGQALLSERLLLQPWNDVSFFYRECFEI